jgi:ammonium transporter, Amt family
MKKGTIPALPLALLLVASTLAAASADAQSVAQVSSTPSSYEAFMSGPGGAMFAVSNLWILIATALIFIMHLGFATIEVGLTQSKNTVNILFKNVFVVCMGVFVYALWGFKAMYPETWTISGLFAFGSPIPNSFSDAATAVSMTSAGGHEYTYWTSFIFQGLFAATASTIVSGAVAERVKLSSFMIYATILSMFMYPLAGSWGWGGGWMNGGLAHLFGKPFHDFAGSTFVHAFGGWASLAAVMVLGPRIGKFDARGHVKPILGHNMPLVAVGGFLLFFGWFGFNGGSVLSADPQTVSRVIVTTTMSGFCGGLVSILVSWKLLHKPDLSMSVNGMLAGLVGITAGADVTGIWGACAIGAIAGAIVVYAVIAFDRIKIDDPVGAISVHGVCGLWGTLAVGIFGTGCFMTQLVGVLAVSLFAFASSFIVFYLIKVTMGVRVSREEERSGLDVGENGQVAYPDFQSSGGPSI